MYSHESDNDSQADVTASAPFAAADAAINFVTTVNKASSSTTAATTSEAPPERDEAEFGILGVAASPPSRLGSAKGGVSWNGNNGAGGSLRSQQGKK
jgi:hypothetical protein